MSTGLRLTGLGIRHAGQKVLDDVSLDIRVGESLCLVGASGGGKSLIAAAVAGMLPACMAEILPLYCPRSWLNIETATESIFNCPDQNCCRCCQPDG